MNTPKPDRPTPVELAGTPVCAEEDRPAIHERGSRGVKARPRVGKGVPGDPPSPSSQTPPTADDLAGIAVSAEGEERTVRLRKPRRKK